MLMAYYTDLIPGACPTNAISIELDIRPIFEVL